jgi:hypothetical protein
LVLPLLTTLVASIHNILIIDAAAVAGGIVNGVFFCLIRYEEDDNDYDIGTTNNIAAICCWIFH